MTLTELFNVCCSSLL